MVVNRYNGKLFLRIQLQSWMTMLRKMDVAMSSFKISPLKHWQLLLQILPPPPKKQRLKSHWIIFSPEWSGWVGGHCGTNGRDMGSAGLVQDCSSKRTLFLRTKLKSFVWIIPIYYNKHVNVTIITGLGWLIEWNQENQ